MDMLVVACGSDAQLHDEVKRWRETLVAHIKASGNDRSKRLNWAKIDKAKQSLITNQEVVNSIEEPEDEVVPEEVFERGAKAPTLNSLDRNTFRDFPA